MFCFVVGLGLGCNQAVRPLWYVWVLLGLASFIGFRIRPAWILLIPTGLAVGILYMASWRGSVLIPWHFNQETSFIGTVVAPADKRSNKTLLTVLPDGLSAAKILVSAERYPAIDYGDRLRVEGTIEQPAMFSGFDYPRYLEKDRIYGTLGRPKKISVVGHNAGNPLLAILYRLRAMVESTAQAVIPEPEAGFLNGIMLGSKRSVPADLTLALQKTGTSHIIAISGANITILLDIVLQLLPLYTLRRQFWVTILIALFMCLLTGASASVVRGALIACLSRWARLNSRRAWTLPLILAGLVMMLFESPLLLVADPGFQLSFAAFAGLGWLGTPCKEMVDRYCSRWPEVVRSSLAETVAASLGTAPVSFALFGQLSLLGFVVNPLILWLLPAITFMGLFLCLAGWLPVAAHIIQLPLWFCLHAVLGLIAWFGKLDVGLIHWKPDWSVSLTLCVATTLLVRLIRKLPRYAPP